MKRSNTRFEKKCAICGKRITASFWICRDCEHEHGLVDAQGKQTNPLAWPEWVRALYNLAQKERYDVVVRGEGSTYEYDDEKGGIGSAGTIDEFEDGD